jgi:hypothetical protein
VNHAIIGMGEVGSALATVLGKSVVWTKDLADKPLPDASIDVVHVCLNYHGLGHERWKKIAQTYVEQLMPKFVSNCSTVAPGTTEDVFREYPVKAIHSTTRGLHPNLTTGLLRIVKHVGGPGAETMAREFSKHGIQCVTHSSSRTTELAHILNNSAYGISLMFADEMAKLCREYGVDYYEAVMKYTETHNRGFRELDHPRLVRSILTPPYGRIGGHCVTQGAELIPDAKRGLLLEMLSRYGKAEPPKYRFNKQTGEMERAVGGDAEDDDTADAPELRDLPGAGDEAGLEPVGAEPGGGAAGEAPAQPGLGASELRGQGSADAG